MLNQFNKYLWCSRGLLETIMQPFSHPKFNPTKGVANPKWNFQQRILHIYILLSCGLSILMGRMTFLQIIQGKHLDFIAQTMQTHRVRPLGKLRRVVDRTGKLLAFDEERFNIAIQSHYFTVPEHQFDANIMSPDDLITTNNLSRCLGLSSNELIRQLKAKPYGLRIASGLDLDMIRYFYELRRFSKGLWVNHYVKRLYPEKSTLANVVGFINLGRIPQSGIEHSRAVDIRNYERALIFRRAGDGTALPNGLESDSFYNDDFCLELTIDIRLQHIASRALLTQMNRWNAKRGVAMVMNVRTGEILALSSYPTYDPNRYWKYSPVLYREWSVQDTSEPGSTFKPINLALALQERVIEPHGRINDIGELKVNEWSIFNHDSTHHGLTDFPTLLQLSSNIGMILAMKDLEPSRYWRWLYQISTKPNTDLFEAASGQIKNKQQFLAKLIPRATVSFGQGLSLSSLKLLQLHAMLANGGRLINPRITRSVGSAHGIQLIDPMVSRTILRWMETVVEKGSGRIVFIPGYRIGAKTGTAQKAKGGHYTARICSFVAHVPIDNPHFVILVAIDEPKGNNAYGSTVAGPVVKDVIETLLVLEQIQPSINLVEVLCKE
uniref:Putative peptidoglycan synthetase (Pbp transpeptidase domain) n=1 Tax=Paulinella longichromatophora TaxID=1708747 RepID=A0A2H4ZQQ7_9EUKA|nr:putative peptidoglycan synthetase (pbp transpeptidase domain) [Paulinella longichromatophora]